MYIFNYYIKTLLNITIYNIYIINNIIIIFNILFILSDFCNDVSISSGFCNDGLSISSGFGNDGFSNDDISIVFNLFIAEILSELNINITFLILIVESNDSIFG